MLPRPEGWLGTRCTDEKKPPVGAGGLFGFGVDYECAPDSARLTQGKPKNQK